MAAIRVLQAALSLSAKDPCEFQDKLGDIWRKTEVSFVSCHVLYCGNAQLGPNEILVSLSFSYFSFFRD